MGPLLAGEAFGLAFTVVVLVVAVVVEAVEVDVIVEVVVFVVFGVVVVTVVTVVVSGVVVVVGTAQQMSESASNEQTRPVQRTDSGELTGIFPIGQPKPKVLQDALSAQHVPMSSDEHFS
mmetsp:Transcript_92636/g.193647  ORF Transcript_92636/g.193647 Transcript_92636/m.193647 type:complete len:120 (-) Transcript_92636:340-699(-)